jgi:hypothetical protein
VQLTAALAEARLQGAKASCRESEQPDRGQAPADAEEGRKRAAEERHRAETEQALRDLQRQQKLLALGSVAGRCKSRGEEAGGAAKRALIARACGDCRGSC